MVWSRRVRGEAQPSFDDAHRYLLRFDNVVLLHGDPVRRPSLDPSAFRFRKTVAREKMIHFSFRGHALFFFNFVRTSHDSLSSHVGITRLEHGDESRGFLLPSFSRARLFESAMEADLQQRLLAVEFLSKPAQSFVNWLPFSELNFRHIPESICNARRCHKAFCFVGAFPTCRDSKVCPQRSCCDE